MFHQVRPQKPSGGFRRVPPPNPNAGFTQVHPQPFSGGFTQVHQPPHVNPRLAGVVGAARAAVNRPGMFAPRGMGRPGIIDPRQAQQAIVAKLAALVAAHARPQAPMPPPQLTPIQRNPEEDGVMPGQPAPFAPDPSTFAQYGGQLNDVNDWILQQLAQHTREPRYRY